MEAVLHVAFLWLLFGGSHVLLATRPIREPLVARLGETGFMWLYVLIACAVFGALVVVYAHVQFVGPAGIALGAQPWARGVLGAACFFGIALTIGAFAPSAYWEAPNAVLADEVRAPRGLGRITRHPIFCGIAVLMGAHALLARHLTGSVFFAGFVVLSILGPLHQARKLERKHGAAFAAYLRETSALPFLAILRNRQRLALGELPWKTLALGAAAALGLQRAHDGILAYYGAPFIAAVVAASVVVGTLSTRRRARTKRGRE